MVPSVRDHYKNVGTPYRGHVIADLRIVCDECEPVFYGLSVQETVLIIQHAYIRSYDLIRFTSSPSRDPYSKSGGSLRSRSEIGLPEG